MEKYQKNKEEKPKKKICEQLCFFQLNSNLTTTNKHAEKFSQK
jgi:hypothetical protein